MADIRTNNACLRPMGAIDLESVLKLRNHPEIRRYMLTQHEISIEEHSLWFKRALQNPSINLFVFEINKKCCGFIQFKKTLSQGVVDWGFYADPDAPKGTGRKLGLAGLHYAFKEEQLHKICGQALHWNRPSIEFHKSLGFAQEGILRDQHFDGATYHDLICFGLLKHEWAGRELLAGRIE
jgi:UDP-4-amino-4,6-dideoxy-N-acetyl-beta-L-altrosamine N-acetyltransferase